MALTQAQQRRREKLIRELAELDEAATATAKPLLSDVATGERSRTAVRPVRDIILDALQDIGFPCYSQQLGVYVRARFGREVTPTRFGSLSVDEEKAFGRGTARPVWLCHALTSDRAEPIKRLWARSDWPLETRLVTPRFGRIQYLRAAAKFSELAMQSASDAADADLMRYLAADHARDLGVQVRHGSFELETWRDMALRQLAEIEDGEKAALKRAGRMLASELTPAESLFGRRKTVLFNVNVDGGKRA